jgi:hypothetical protein
MEDPRTSSDAAEQFQMEEEECEDRRKGTEKPEAEEERQVRVVKQKRWQRLGRPRSGSGGQSQVQTEPGNSPRRRRPALVQAAERTGATCFPSAASPKVVRAACPAKPPAALARGAGGRAVEEGEAKRAAPQNFPVEKEEVLG